jgi:hypothetical protein
MTTLIRTFGGNIGIGTNDPGSYKLRVDGSVRATSLEVGGVTNAHIPSGAIGIWYGNSTDIPPGWVICDGANGTPDLRNKFIRCANLDINVNQIGGSDNTTLTDAAMLASHSHPVSVSAANSPHKHNVGTGYAAHSHGTSSYQGSHYHTAQKINWRQLRYYINNNVGAQVGGQWATHATSEIPWELTLYGGVHNHNLPTNNIPHSHGGGSQRSVHTHPASSGNTGTGAAIPVTNPYYALYYIMKL